MASTSGPFIVVLAGPNGAGKSTVAPSLLQGELGVTQFINADVIAAGLSAFAPERAAIAAGRIMLARAKELAARGESFALETTLASRSLAPWLQSLIDDGYRFHLVILWLPSEDLAIARVAERVCLRGHDVPADTIRRRYHAGLRNFFDMYRPMSSTWQVFENTGVGAPRCLADGIGASVRTCTNKSQWDDLETRYGRG
jgi:predicted ABC-type ATPase